MLGTGSGNVSAGCDVAPMLQILELMGLVLHICISGYVCEAIGLGTWLMMLML